ncbi:hypothetical protein WP7S18C02_34430 [Klebsiella sp. WP7-S18-CRE-02]|uniref:phage tail tape measure protein n=1 Tax=unclassified Klebsiella TaxID=2608929 RepID=UPI0015DCF502|nr:MULTISPECIES: phage tail tape measure protein [unclassified Klebsiella]HAT3955508.1 phage tail protein [Kluyvera ascorbata]BBR57922.1 hypothetical protein WP4W18E05_12900 [Klebsiella sp. WP4-W18-ESBL-05]BBS92828.1 hypothetical protein WP7S18C02_34430 [Klebsiella sp. WP7-S18-CRE-02]BBS97857.1 hypothetical protein WP7S18C03_34500 [Klebsiella sp. WP7-S18-CRE-03]BBT02924.1 hypothetical protein WP7S18E04_34860 [Klebsiella sp. WP7-S18-ESBL-04]
MASRLTTEILINLAGNLTAKARQYGANMSEFARRNERVMSVVKATTAAAGRGLDALGNRYTGMIAGFATGVTVRGIADFDAQMRRMGTDAQLTQEQVSALHEQIREVSNQKDIRIDASALGQGVGELLGKTGDYEFAEKNLRNMGVLMQAFGVDGQTAAGLLAQFWEKGVRGADDVSQMLDKLYAQFAVGSVSVADIAKVAPKLFSIIQDQGPTAIAQMGAFAQVFAKNKGSAEETVTSIQAMYAALSNKKNIEFLKLNGIDVFKKGTKELKLPFELMKEILKRAKNDPIKLQDVFDQTGMQGINSLLKPENIKLMEELIYGTVEIGSTQKAAQTNAEGFNSAMQSLNNEWQRFAESELAKPIQELADALNSVDHKTVDNWLQIGKNLMITVGGVIAARKAFKLGKGAMDILGVGTGKGIPKGVADVFGSGVMPVYVVNMGKGGMGNDSGPDLPDGPDKKPTSIHSGLITTALSTASELTSIMPFPETEEQKSDLLQKVKENNNRSTMWSDIKDWFISTANEPQVANPQPWASLQPQASSYPSVPPSLKGEIRVVVEGDARVKSVKMDQPGITLSAQSGVSNVEQN